MTCPDPHPSKLGVALRGTLSRGAIAFIEVFEVTLRLTTLYVCNCLYRGREGVGSSLAGRVHLYCKVLMSISRSVLNRNLAMRELIWRWASSWFLPHQVEAEPTVGHLKLCSKLWNKGLSGCGESVHLISPHVRADYRPLTRGAGPLRTKGLGRVLGTPDHSTFPCALT